MSESSHIESSLTDMMTSLMVIFILLLVVFLNQQYLDEEEKKQDTKNTLANIKEDLEKNLISNFDGIRVVNDPVDPLTLVVIVPEGHLNFKLNRHDLSSESLEFVEIFAPKFLNIICSEEFYGKLDSVLVEGHTDSSGEDYNNLPLSQRRSLEVLLKMINYSGENKDCFLEIVSASGRGEKELVLKNGKEVPELSRRVQFKIRVKSLMLDEFKKELPIQDQLEVSYGR